MSTQFIPGQNARARRNTTSVLGVEVVKNAQVTVESPRDALGLFTARLQGQTGLTFRCMDFEPVAPPEPFNEVKRLPADWSKDLGIDVLDPDGWRVDSTPWGLAITEQDFRRRAAMSTMREVTTPAPPLPTQDGDGDGREAAPLDPALVKAGDTVEVEVANDRIGVPTYTVKGEVHDDATGRPWVGPIALLSDYRGGPLSVTLTAHQPAPEPEPEPGTVGTAVVGHGDFTRGGRTFRKAHGMVVGKGTFIEPEEGGYRIWEAADWKGLVPDEPRLTRDALTEALQETAQERETRSSFAEDAELILAALLRGESR